MNLEEAIDRALKKQTLVKALAFMAIWESERAIRQRDECLRTGVSTAAHEGTHDTCFEASFTALFHRLGMKKIPELRIPGGTEK